MQGSGKKNGVLILVCACVRLCVSDSGVLLSDNADSTALLECLSVSLFLSRSQHNGKKRMKTDTDTLTRKQTRAQARPPQGHQNHKDTTSDSERTTTNDEPLRTNSSARRMEESSRLSRAEPVLSIPDTHEEVPLTTSARTRKQRKKKSKESQRERARGALEGWEAKTRGLPSTQRK